MSPLHKQPTYLLLLLWLLCLVLGMAAAVYAVRQPSLGFTLEVVDDQVRVGRITAPQGVAIPPGARVLHLNGMEVLPGDLYNDPDMTLSFAELNAYYSRLDALASAMQGNQAELGWADDEGRHHTTAIELQTRSLRDLSHQFWFVWLVGSLCLMVGAWVYVLKPQDWSARLFALSGLFLMVSAFPAAIYYTRELTYGSGLLRVLLILNHFGAMMYMGALIGLFLRYPRALVRPRHLLWAWGLYLLLFVLDTAQVLVRAHDHMLAITSGMLVVCATAMVQWWLTRGQPVERAALRWFLLAMLVGLSLTMVTFILPPLLGEPPMLPTAYVFGFFLIMYIGIALGLRRYRLFDMDEWSYRVLLWVAGATSVIVLDALLIYAGLTQGASLGLSLLLCGWLYFPLRQWLWQRMVNRSIPNFESLLPELSAIAFAAGSEMQHTLWQTLLRRIYEPLELQTADASEAAGIRDDGLVMVVPGCGELPPLHLRHARHGARLFSSRDAVFATSLCHALERMMGGRQSFEAGASQERQRIYRDLHDDMGAKLLGLAISAQRANRPKEADLARSALQDLRDVVSRATHTTTPLADLLADWRMEAQQRAQAAGIVLEWSFPVQEHDILLNPETALNLTRILREAISNVLRHAQASHIRVASDLDTEVFSIIVEDDGIGLPRQATPHRGMSSMQARASALDAEIEWQRLERGCRVTLSVPLSAITP